MLSAIIYPSLGEQAGQEWAQEGRRRQAGTGEAGAEYLAGVDFHILLTLAWSQPF